MPSRYIVRRGDTLSAIAAREYGSAALYPSLWWVNKAKVHDPNVVEVGQVLKLSRWHPQAAWLADAAKRADPPVVRTVAYTRSTGRHAAGSGGHHDQWDGHHYPGGCGDGDGDGLGDMPCSMLHHGGTVVYRSSGRSGRSYRAVRSYSGRASSSGGGRTYRGSGGCQSHIIGDESGGNASAVNPSSGAGGLYQFLPSTWHALGHSGLPQNASVAEQNQAYHQQVAQSGYSAWAASGGC